MTQQAKDMEKGQKILDALQESIDLHNRQIKTLQESINLHYRQIQPMRQAMVLLSTLMGTPPKEVPGGEAVVRETLVNVPLEFWPDDMLAEYERSKQQIRLMVMGRRQK
jgi:hypothetical protein